MTADKLIAAYHNAELHYDDTGDMTTCLTLRNKRSPTPLRSPPGEQPSRRAGSRNGHPNSAAAALRAN
jgi:hypothetical protein